MIPGICDFELKGRYPSSKPKEDLQADTNHTNADITPSTSAPIKSDADISALRLTTCWVGLGFDQDGRYPLGRGLGRLGGEGWGSHPPFTGSSG